MLDASGLSADGFERVGEIRPEDGTRCRAYRCELTGTVIYALVVENRVMKIGTSGTRNATLDGRMRQTAGDQQEHQTRNHAHRGVQELGKPDNQRE